MNAKIMIIMPLISFISLAASAQPGSALPKQADADTMQLLLLMDRDESGKVSRAEFMNFMAAEFNRLDVNRDGELDVNELMGLRVVSSKHPGGTGSR